MFLELEKSFLEAMQIKEPLPLYSCSTRIHFPGARESVDILDLYEQPYDARCPLICLNQGACQLLGDVMAPMKPGSTKKLDYHYQRKDTCNVLMACGPLQIGNLACLYSTIVQLPCLQTCRFRSPSAGCQANKTSIDSILQ